MIETISKKIPDDNIKNLENGIHIYYTSQKLDEESIVSLEKILSEDEVARANRFFFEKDKKYYIVSRGILRILLSKYIDIDCKEIHFNYNEFGKPELNNKLLNTNFEFNLSHSNGKAIFALVLGRKIGVDIEKIRPIERIDQIVNSFFSEKEKEEFNSLNDDLKKMAFWNCWTRKEAYIKAHGKGLSIPLSQFSVSIMGDEIKLEHIFDGEFLDENWCINDVKIGMEFVSAVAYEGGFLPIICTELLK